MIRTYTTAMFVSLALLGGGTAAAQWDPEGGDNWQQPPPDQQQQQQQQQQPPPDQQQQGWQQGQQGQNNQQAGWGQPPPDQQQQQEEQPPQWGEGQAPPGEGEEEQSDHAAHVGHLGVGYFGVLGVPVGVTGGPGGGAERSITAPIIGIRFWLSELIGLDIGIGFGYTSTGQSAGDVATSVTVIDENGFAFGLHAGLPLALHHSKHYKFLIVPEANIGYGTYTIIGATAAADQGLTGLLFTLGARVGTEIHFGFIGIPDLSLQASVGLGLNIGVRSWDTNFGDIYQDRTDVGISTSVQNEPWNIFIANVAAIYYL